MSSEMDSQDMKAIREICKDDIMWRIGRVETLLSSAEDCLLKSADYTQAQTRLEEAVKYCEFDKTLIEVLEALS